MMTKGMKSSIRGKDKLEDKSTNIVCPECKEVVGVVAAGFSLVLNKDAPHERHVGLCVCGKKIVYRIARG